MGAHFKHILQFNGTVLYAQRNDFYVKRGEYKHGTVKGWEGVLDGDVVISGDPGAPMSAYEFQKPKFPTFKSLVAYVAESEYVKTPRENREKLRQHYITEYGVDVNG